MGLWRSVESSLGVALSSQTIFSVNSSYLGIPDLPRPSPQFEDIIKLHLGSLFKPQSGIFPHEVIWEALRLTSFVSCLSGITTFAVWFSVLWEPLPHMCYQVLSCLWMEGKTRHYSPIQTWKQISVNLVFFMLGSYEMGILSIKLFLGYLVSTYNLLLKQRTSWNDGIIWKLVFFLR